MPHPSLSLTWIFSLILAPLFLYRLLKNLDIGQNIAAAMVAFYLATPGVLSFEAMLFRPGKPMTNFFIIFCLYLASKLKKEFLDKDKPIPVIKFLIFWIITACSFYWDETALLIFPAVLFIFPSIFRRKLFLFFWFLLPLMTLAAYLEIIPYLCVLAGHDWPHLFKYDLVQSIHQPGTIHNSISYLGVNARNLVLETMGIFPFSNTAPKLIIISMALAIVSWITILFYIFKVKKGFDPLLIFLIFLLFWFNAMMSVTMFIWGPYYYGSFWSVFFIVFLSKHIEKSNIPKFVLFICFFFIIISASNSFIGINIIYKKYHWYPYSPDTIEDYFKGTRLFFDKRDAPIFSDKDIRLAIYKYWIQVRNGINIKSLSLPGELDWLPIELEPTKIELTSHLAEAYNNRGNIYFKLGNFTQAISDYNKAVELKGNYEDPYYNLGFTYYKQGNLTQAISNYNKAIEINPKDTEAYHNLAVIYYQLKQYDKARNALINALKQVTGRIN